MNTTQWIRGLAAGVTALALCGPAHAVDPSYSGSWYTPAESGSGFNLEIFSDERALLFWYTYDDNGEAVWLYSEGVLNGQRIDFDVYYSDGMRFSDMDGADKVNRRWGSLTMTFADCDNATIGYASTLTGLEHSPVGTRTLPVEKLVGIDGLPCRPAMTGYWSGRYHSVSFEDGTSRWVDVAGPVAGGTMYLYAPETNELLIGSASADTATEGYYGFAAYRLDTSESIAWDGPASFRARDYLVSVEWVGEYGDTKPHVLELSYRTTLDREVSVAALAGEWTFTRDGSEHVLTVREDGTATLDRGDGCPFAGALKPWQSGTTNAFHFHVWTQCEPREVLEGMVVNIDVDPGDRRALELFLGTDAGGADHRVAVRR